MRGREEGGEEGGGEREEGGRGGSEGGRNGWGRWEGGRTAEMEGCEVRGRSDANGVLYMYMYSTVCQRLLVQLHVTDLFLVGTAETIFQPFAIPEGEEEEEEEKEEEDVEFQ